MRKILLENMINAVDGVINNNVNTENMHITGVSIDSRSVKKGDLFVCIVGDNFDGHNFIKQAFLNGAIACISEKNTHNEGIVINVKNTRIALKKFAMYYRMLFDIKVVAITGSTGKTTVKDMLASCLLQKYNVVKTKGNFNNEIGLPLTIFDIQDDTDVAVLEMGMNHFGEIKELSKVAMPDIAVITNIGLAHVENLGNREGIFRAKYEIFEHLKDNGIKILNGDDDILYTLYDEKKGFQKEKYFYSLHKKLDAYATDIRQNSIYKIGATLNYFGKSIDVDINYAGEHIVSNALLVCLVCDKLNLSENEIKKGLEDFKLSKMRLNIIKTEKYTIIDDTYNANPTSMKASLDILASTNGRKVAIIGDMLELGEYSQKEHYNMGKYACEKNIDEIILVGEQSYHTLQGAKENKTNNNITYFKSQKELMKNIEALLQKEDIILVKASRAMKLENTVDKIMG